VAKVFVNATGARGGSYNDYVSYGGWVQASISVTAGQILYLFVGGVGLSRSSFNGGGSGGAFTGSETGGGGAFTIRTSSGDLTTRLIVAGGGGGTDFLSVFGYSSPGNGGK
jgi:Glycine rich protein